MRPESAHSEARLHAVVPLYAATCSKTYPATHPATHPVTHPVTMATT